MPLSLRVVLSTSRREKVFFYFLPTKRVKDTCFKNSSVVLQFFFSVATDQKWFFGQYTRVDSDRIHRFCPARSDRNNKAHAILSCDKLQGAFNQFTEKVWKLQLKYFSYKRDQRRSFASTFICISKFTKLHERILKMQALIGLK